MDEFAQAVVSAIWADMQARKAAWQRFVDACAKVPPPQPAPNYPQGVDIER